MHVKYAHAASRHTLHVLRLHTVDNIHNEAQTPSMFYLHREKHSITLSKNPNLPNDLLLNTLMISNVSYIVSIKHVV